jgi:Tol biopolymer transport system component
LIHRRRFLFAASLLSGCQSSGGSASTQATLGDAKGVQARDVAAIFAAGVISDTNEQWRITFTPDGRTAYFSESAGFFPFTRQATIYMSRRVSDRWSDPQVASFSGTFSDIDPFISPDGDRLYFSSIRPVAGVTRGDLDIWMVSRTAAGWGDAIRLGAEVNTEADELYPSASADGTLYFASGPRAPAAGRHWDIYRAASSPDGFTMRENLGAAVNTSPSSSDANLQSAWDFNPEISVDGKTLVFTSLRPGFGFGDLYASHLRDGAWTPAQNLGPAVNSAADEYHPTLSRDGEELYFVRRGPAPGNFYVISTKRISALQR